MTSPPIGERQTRSCTSSVQKVWLLSNSAIFGQPARLAVGSITAGFHFAGLGVAAERAGFGWLRRVMADRSAGRGRPGVNAHVMSADWPRPSIELLTTGHHLPQNPLVKITKTSVHAGHTMRGRSRDRTYDRRLVRPVLFR